MKRYHHFPLSLITVKGLAFLFLAALALTQTASAQFRPSLSLQISAGQPSLSLTGNVGTVYSIQYAIDLSPTNQWTERTLVQARGASFDWTDPSANSMSQKFYRAVSVLVPGDTNLVFVQPGTFTMGSPTNEALRGTDETQHTVTVSRGFWMGKYLVTQGDYLSVVGTNPSYFTTNDYNGNPINPDLTRPVEQVSWFDAINYCVLRTQRELAAGLIPTNCVYRLPTESEWEYAARAGTSTAGYAGSYISSSQGNFYGLLEYDAAMGVISNPDGVFLGATSSVGSYPPNGWGFYDLIGNVSEWCQDWYDVYPVGSVIDPQGPLTGSDRVFRHGDWQTQAQYNRSAFRGQVRPSDKDFRAGFRVVLSLVQ